MLENLTENGLLDLFDERRIFFPEIDEEGREIARLFGFACSGSERNLGIFGGFQALARSMKSETLLLLENDIHVIEPLEEVARQLNHSANLVARREAAVVQLRHRKDPGQNIDASAKYRRYYCAPNAPMVTRLLAATRRAIRPSKAQRMVGGAPYVEDRPEIIHPKDYTIDEAGFLSVSSSTRNWTNQSFMIDRRFFLDCLMRQVDQTETRRSINGFKNIEIELNSRWWRDQKFTVSIAPGLFTHERIGYRGY